MKLECSKEKLYRAMSLAEKLTGKNLALPILSFVLCEAKNNQLTIKSTNLDLGIEVNLPVKVTKPGIVAIPGTIFSQFLSNLPEESNISVEDVGGNVSVDSKGTHVLLKTSSHEDFPTIPKPKTEKNFKIKAKDFAKGLRSVWFSASLSAVKPELASVFVWSDADGLVFVATDSFRLAEKKINVKKVPDIGNVLIPFKNINEIIRILDVDEEAEVAIGNGQISFYVGNIYLTSRTIDGNFPDYKQIIPKEWKSSVTALKKDLVSALKIANIFSDAYSHVSMRIVPKDKIFEIQTKNPDIGENDTAVQAVIEGENMTLSFNHKYISECFGSIEADSAELKFAGTGRPMIIHGIGDKSFTYIVMPMNK